MTTLNQSISVRRLIKANRSHVFEAFSNAKSLAQWFSPSPNITVEVLAFEFVLKGDFRIRYSMPDGSFLVVAGSYHRISPPDELVFSWVWQAPDPHADILTQVHVQFRDKGDSTEIVLSHNKLPSKEACDRYTAGWQGTFDNLENFLATDKYPTTGAVHDV